ncbi:MULTISPECIES: gamma-glutamylcyclotransferase family protein [unclassified Pseudofrankia]|uniref:gamma-glutamylcyclotransferase family protein n=1 Tax=unclassified Pseudofrankia TaxID=2994372 RepID=UPI0008DA0363|nr:MULTISPECIES: gamma-glutamylcyclotransferase family protein [unclassified Pseudofrankia]MDT3438576.1 gamma-glutamylcyclotransferase family protein [Pseudofrankia sp. BMG5.37]OHV49477.1 hypothetical protein BCD48_12690 [Pseudofrankia sp. BMG5.36]
MPVGERAGLALFAYGTLMFGDIVEALLGRRPAFTAAVIAGWRAARLPGRVYPGLVPAAGRRASGLLLSGLCAAEWALLDDFEGDAYVLCPVETETLGGTAAPGCLIGGDGLGRGSGPAGEAARGALAYAWRAVDDVEEGDWDSGWFASHCLGRYAARLRLGADG